MQVRKYQGHSYFITSVAISPDKRFVLTSSQDQTTRIWNAATGIEERRLETKVQQDSIAVSHDSRFALTTGQDNVTRLWDIATGKEIHRLGGDSEKSHVAAFSPDGRLIATGGEKEAILWNASTGERQSVLTGYSGPVGLVAFSSDGRRLMTSASGTVRLWEVDSAKQISQFQAGTVLAFSNDGQFVLCNAEDRTTQLLDSMTGKPVRRYLRHIATAPAVFSPDDQFVFTKNNQTTLLIPGFRSDYNAAGQRSLAEAEQSYALNTLESRKTAVEKYNEAVRWFFEAEDERGSAAAYAGMSAAHQALSEYDKAIEARWIAAILFHRVGAYSEEAASLTALGDLYVLMADSQQALDHYGQALLLVRSISDTAGEMKILESLAEFYDSRGQTEIASDYKKLAQALLDTGDRLIVKPAPEQRMK
jgi:hypothetical protein